MKFGMALAAQVGAALHLLHVLEVIAGAEPLSRQIESRQTIEQAIEATERRGKRRAPRELRGPDRPPPEEGTGVPVG